MGIIPFPDDFIIGLNPLYSYALNNPYSFVDQDGAFPDVPEKINWDYAPYYKVKLTTEQTLM